MQTLGRLIARFYLTYSTGSATSISLQMPGQATAASIPTVANQVLVPVGATLAVATSGSTINATGFCIP
jgi:hypothetical protein